MVKILLSYFYILFISFGIGLIFKKWINLERYNVLFTILIGFFSQLIISTFYSVFFPLNGYFYFLNVLISTIIFIFFFSSGKVIINNTKNTFTKFSTKTKLFLFVVLILSILHSSSLPFLADNESYYIQTIKWLNNYGLVRGIVNFHLFFGQFSGWHILQGSFNLSFLQSNFNDLNGLLLIITSFYCAEKWENYKRFGIKNDLFIALIFITMVFLFLFIPSPSPDFPILIITPLIFHLFLESFQKTNKDNTAVISILSILIVLIKVTIFPILLLPLFILIKSKNLKNWRLVVIVSFLALSSFLIKNIIISGYPFYPLKIGNELINVDWKLNHKLQLMSYRQSKMTAYQMNNWEDFMNLNFINRFWIWLNLPKLNGLFNKIIILSLILFPLFLRKQKGLKYIIIYILLQFVIFYATSPQYRFFAPVLLTIGLLISTELLHQRFVAIKFLIISNVALLFFIGLFGLNFSRVTNNDIMVKKPAFISSQIISPRAITQFENLKYKKYKIGNLEYYSPLNDSLFFWQTSNGPLPCANKEMIEYFSIYYDHIPQMRTKYLKDGFKSVKP